MSGDVLWSLSDAFSGDVQNIVNSDVQYWPVSLSSWDAKNFILIFFLLFCLFILFPFLLLRVGCQNFHISICNFLSRFISHFTGKKCLWSILSFCISAEREMPKLSYWRLNFHVFLFSPESVNHYEPPCQKHKISLVDHFQTLGAG